MTNCRFREEDYRDIEAVNEIKALRAKPFSFITVPIALKKLSHYSRDHARTPMQWSADKNAGFTTGEPWLMVNPNYTEINTAEQESREDSVLNFYRKTLKIRKEYIDTVRDGEFIPVDENNREIMAYVRKTDDKTLLVACSLSPKKAKLTVPSELLRRNKVVLTNADKAPRLAAEMTFEPCTCAVWEIENI